MRPNRANCSWGRVPASGVVVLSGKSVRVVAVELVVQGRRLEDLELSTELKFQPDANAIVSTTSGEVSILVASGSSVSVIVDDAPRSVISIAAFKVKFPAE